MRNIMTRFLLFFRRATKPLSEWIRFGLFRLDFRAKWETREAIEKVGSLHDKVYPTSFMLPLCFYAAFRSSTVFFFSWKKNFFNLISGFIYRESAMLARKKNWIVRRVNDTIGNSISHVVRLLIMFRGLERSAHSLGEGSSCFLLCNDSEQELAF